MSNRRKSSRFTPNMPPFEPCLRVHLVPSFGKVRLDQIDTRAIHAYKVQKLDLEVGVTSLSHDSFTGMVYAGLADLGVVEVDPFTGEFLDFQTMPGKGRVAVSPDGKL